MKKSIVGLAVLGLLVVGVAVASSASAADGAVTVTGTFTAMEGQAAAGRDVKVNWFPEATDNPYSDAAQICHDFWGSAKPWNGVTDAKGVYVASLPAPPSDCPSLVVEVRVWQVEGLPQGSSDSGSADKLVQANEMVPGSVITVDVQGEDVRTWADDPTGSVARAESAGGPASAVMLALLGVGLFALLVFLARLVAQAAVRKGRNFWPWFWIAFVLLIPAAIIVAIMKNESDAAVQKVEVASQQRVNDAPSERVSESTTQSTSAATQEAPTKQCPFCGETILAVAKKCKHCGEFLDQ